MEVMPEETLGAEKKELNRIYKELIDSMLPYQDEKTGMWYQVVNRGGIRPNYLETSGSAIFAYAIMKSVRPVSYTHLDVYKRQACCGPLITIRAQATSRLHILFHSCLLFSFVFFALIKPLLILLFQKYT